MNLNLVFKKEIVSPDTPGGKRMLMKIIPVNLDGVDESWHLASCAHGVEFCKQGVEVGYAETTPLTVIEGTTLTASDVDSVSVETAQKPDVKYYNNGDSFPAPCEGTAKLVRKNNIITICYRKGKSANMTAPNALCINDYDKQIFFKDCNRIHSGVYRIVEKDDPKEYDYWSTIMDKGYADQLRLVNQKISSDNS